MYKIVAFLILPFILYGFDINFGKKFTEEIVPNKLSTKIVITIDKDREDKLSPILNRFNIFISQEKDIEKKDGQFFIEPRYTYNGGKSKIIGYSGILKYSIYSTNDKNMNSFLKALLNLKKNKDISISISSLKWIVDDSKNEKVLASLRLKSILFGKKYASEISVKIDNFCVLKNINITSHSFRPFYNISTHGVKMSSSINESNIPVPQANKNSLSIEVNYILECK